MLQFVYEASIRTCFSTCLKEGFVGGIDTPAKVFLARDLVIRTKFSWTSEVETFSLFAFGCIEEGQQYIIYSEKTSRLANPAEQTGPSHYFLSKIFS